MARKLLGMGVAVLACWATAGCQKNVDAAGSGGGPGGSVELVAAAERSRHFAAVQQHLELGGTVYGYVDIDGDAERLAHALKGFADGIAADQPQAAVLRQDFVQIFADLGLSDVKALGLSSVPDPAGGFRNRCFFYTPAGRHGLLAGFGGPAAPFRNLALAPADADLFSESEIDLPAVYAAVRRIVARVGGDTAANVLEDQLKSVGNDAGFSAYDLVQRWKGRYTCIARFEEEGTIRLPSPQPVQIPAFSLLLRLDGVAPAVKDLLDRLPAFARTEEGAVSFYALQPTTPIESWSPLIAIDGDALYIATTRDFYNACRGPGPRLAANPAMAAALERLGREGNGLNYVSPRFFARLHQLPELNRGAAPEVVRSLGFAVRNLPAPTQPLVGIRTNLPDGVLFRSAWHSSLKEDLAMVAVYNPVTIGALAAMAVPAFQKVRANAHEAAIRNNLRELATAAEIHYQETGSSNATYDDLVGPDRAIRHLKPVAGENYRSIIFKAGAPVRLRLPDGRTYEARP